MTNENNRITTSQWGGQLLIMNGFNYKLNKKPEGSNGLKMAYWKCIFPKVVTYFFTSKIEKKLYNIKIQCKATCKTISDSAIISIR